MVVSPGTSIGVYRIESALGAGGMGEVYLATDTRLNRPVALKFLSSGTADENGRRRFQQEVRAVSSLNHPHILTVYEAGEFQGQAFLATEFVDGGTLGAWAQTGTRSWRQIVDLLIGVADGLAVAHDAGILHRDVKSANILVARNGYAKLADFGLAKLTATDQQVTRTASEPRTRAGAVVGTLDYMSPEQLSGALVDRRSDVFSFGVVLYEMLAGRRPFAGTTDLHVAEGILHQPPPPLDETVPPALREIVVKALEKDPADRYQSMRDLVVDLRRTIRQTAETPARQPAAAPRRGWIAAAMVAVFLAAVAATAWWFGLGVGIASDAMPVESVAVLPLQNLSGDPAEDYFSDGMTEQLIATLAQVRALKVISRTSVMRFKNSTKSLPEIARELGVDAILEGSVRRAEGRVRVTAQLIHASSDAHLWADDFDRDFTEVLALQADIAQAIVREIRIRMTPDEATRLAAVREVNPQAHEAYSLGRHQYWRADREGNAKAIEYFEEAIRLQDDYAAAHASLSMAWQQSRAFGFGQNDMSMRAAAQKAVDLDPNLAEAHAALAGVKFEDWDWTGAVTAYDRALALNPDSVDCGCYAVVLAALDRLPEALELGAHIQRVNPLSPEAHFNYGFALYMARRYADAERHFLRVLELEPRRVPAAALLSMTYLLTGRAPDAFRIADRPALRASSVMARVYAATGRRLDAQRLLEEFPATDPYSIAVVELALGNKDKGLDALDQAVDRRQGLARWMKVDPSFNSVRADPRFQAILARLKLPE